LAASAAVPPDANASGGFSAAGSDAKASPGRKNPICTMWRSITSPIAASSEGT
jgi:hypothetical protein